MISERESDFQRKRWKKDFIEKVVLVLKASNIQEGKVSTGIRTEHMGQNFLLTKSAKTIFGEGATF